MQHTMGMNCNFKGSADTWTMCYILRAWNHNTMEKNGFITFMLYVKKLFNYYVCQSD